MAPLILGKLHGRPGPSKRPPGFALPGAAGACLTQKCNTNDSRIIVITVILVVAVIPIMVDSGARGTYLQDQKLHWCLTAPLRVFGWGG